MLSPATPAKRRKHGWLWWVPAECRRNLGALAKWMVPESWASAGQLSNLQYCCSTVGILGHPLDCPHNQAAHPFSLRSWGLKKKCAGRGSAVSKPSGIPSRVGPRGCGMPTRLPSKSLLCYGAMLIRFNVSVGFLRRAVPIRGHPPRSRGLLYA